ncbi:hypothetical protein ACOMHN_015711 [Nucella lapillus]
MSGRINLKDRHGNDIYFGHGGVVFFPEYEEIDDYREQVKKIRHMELRDDDVIITAYPRSGTHWRHQIVHMLMENTSEYVGSLPDDLIDWKPVDQYTHGDQPRVLVTHLHFEFLPRQVLEKKVKIVYCYRNPKDTWVSNYNCARDICAFKPYHGTWPQFYDLMMDIGYWYGDWFDHVQNWENAARQFPDMVCLSCYETMKKNPVDEIVKLDQFLGLNRGRALCEQIAKACHFPNLKAAHDQKESMADIWQNGADGMYRKGEVGEWKNWFTQAQNEHFDSVFEKRMGDSTLPFIFQ